MLAPRRLDTSVRVLDRQKTNRVHLKKSARSNVEGRKSLVVAEWQRTQMLKEIKKPGDVDKGEYFSPTIEVLSGSQVANASTAIISVAVQATSTVEPQLAGAAKVDIESIPGPNQDKPAGDDAVSDSPVLPGINQVMSSMRDLPKPVSPAAATDSPQPPSAPAITVNKPLPGQNQENPIMADVAPPPAPTASVPASSAPLPIPPPLLTSVDNQASVPLPFTASSQSSSQATSRSESLSTSAPTIQSSEITSRPTFPRSSVLSFITVTRSEQGKLEAPISVALSSTPSTVAIATSSAGAYATGGATTLAVAAAQSASGAIASISVAAVATANSSAASSTQNESILHPTARTLLILFVVLGILSIIVAIVISMMVRSHRRQSQASRQKSRHQVPYDASIGSTGVASDISANRNSNPFLTPSEKAIISRTASPEANTGTTDSSGFADAITLFIKKSRRLTYKISP